MKATYVVLMQVTGMREDCCIFRDENPSSINWF